MAELVTVDGPFVSVVVPVWNGERTIGDCLASVLRAEYPAERREVIVVDNASRDRTAEIVARYPVRCVDEPERGPSAARNRGIAVSRGKVVAFIDADCIVTKRWLAELVAGFADEETFAVAGEIVAYPPVTPAERYHAMRKSRWQASALSSTRPFAITANVAFRRETFDRIGLFDPRLRTAQDKDFGWRFFEAGLKLLYNERAVVFHRHRPTGWGLFKQHVLWGYGAALLHQKHSLPWSLGKELRKYGELVVALGTGGRAAIRYARYGGDQMKLYYPLYELVRRAGLRVGALYGMVHRLPRATESRSVIRTGPP
ncbi:MAG: glycosyltransferase [Actinomycetota bacterium]|nr:glycosyltransferase [Actinomycetota bacterium]